MPQSVSLTITDTDIIGFRRLAIMDLSLNGSQPFYFRNNLIKLVCNGEIYNHKILEKKYNIHTKSRSDCECIMYLFDKLGFKETLQNLNGDYAIALSTKDMVYFARDPIGVRPLFYGRTDEGGFALASYAKALTGFCTDITQLSPGWGTYDRTSGKISIYRHDHTPKIVYHSIHGLEQIVKTTLINSVKQRMMTNRPMGCLLSGGLDSSLLTSIMCELIGAKNVRTYSIGMVGSQDLHHAGIVAKYLGTDHTEVLFTPEEGFAAIPAVIEDLESYDITTIRASVGMWLLAKHISDNTDDVVLLSGEGADELFCGYLYFHSAPSPTELSQESLRLVENLYLYDALRADRCISSHGLELRVPFLDKEMVSLCLSLGGHLKEPKNGLEKCLLRSAFVGNYLPEDVLKRRKDGMSDGISGDSGKKWFEQIQEFVEKKVGDVDISNFPSKEAYYYKTLYDKLFPTYQPTYDYWLPKWVECGGDPSGRVLEVFKNTSL